MSIRLATHAFFDSQYLMNLSFSRTSVLRSLFKPNGPVRTTDDVWVKQNRHHFGLSRICFLDKAVKSVPLECEREQQLDDVPCTRTSPWDSPNLTPSC